ncbi:MAG TPA: hypothetical protein EYG51_03510 [Pseudomonadales bacterium]|nr:hypothetical protein [Pseudomonadales bacterium]
MRFKRVIIWGHHLHSHTHSYIHDGFLKAFKHLGHDAHWVSEADNISTDFFDDALVITEGQVDSNIPLVKRASYLLHNCDTRKYEELELDFKVLQVYSHDCLDRGVTELAPATFYQSDNRTLYQPWATDLLPIEMHSYDLITDASQLKPWCNWVGSIMHGLHGNQDQLHSFAAAAAEKNIEFRLCRNVSPKDSIKLVRESQLAPALQGQWQVENGYIPCRIFKNISYGHLGLTNSKAVFDLLEGEVIFNKDCAQLFKDGQAALGANDAQRQRAFNLIRAKHTYINRIEKILEVMEY